MKKQVQTGWICRTWKYTAENGWTSEIDRFATEEEAIHFGRTHCKMLHVDEVTREYEVYKDFTDPF